MPNARLARRAEGSRGVSVLILAAGLIVVTVVATTALSAFGTPKVAEDRRWKTYLGAYVGAHKETLRSRQAPMNIPGSAPIAENTTPSPMASTSTPTPSAPTPSPAPTPSAAPAPTPSAPSTPPAPAPGPTPTPAVAVTEAPAVSSEATPTGYQFWSSDFHIATAGDVKDLFKQLGMSVYDQSLSGACESRGTCAKELKVLNRDNGQSLCPNPNDMRRRFYDAYKDDEKMKTIDGFVCSHPPSLCELFMPFNRPIIVYATVNLEFNRESDSRFGEWMSNLQAIAKKKGNVVAANSLYDAKYIEYFSGIKAEVLPSYCGYVADIKYNPTRPQILLGRNHNNPRQYDEIKESLGAKSIVAEKIEILYPRYEYSDLAQHKAIVCIPYTKSVMSYFEFYRMGIPMIFPSVDLLAKWEKNDSILKERIYWSKTPTKINPPPFPYSPNDRSDTEAIRYWLEFCDFYVWPHILYFDDYDDLETIIKNTDFNEVSRKMLAHSEKLLGDLKASWEGHFRDMFSGKKPGHWETEATFDEAMMKGYGITVGPAEADCTRHSKPEWGQWT